MKGEAAFGRPALRLFALLSLSPAIAGLTVAAEALQFRWAMGRWPVPSLDDPKQQACLPFHPIAQLVVMSEPAFVVVALAAALAFGRFAHRRRSYRLALLLLAGGILLNAAIPMRLWEWFWD